MSQATTFPTKSFYSDTNPLYPNFVGECTWYVTGRAHEKYGVTGLPTSGAGLWYNQATGFTRLGRDEDPPAGAIACFSGGHVLFIEGVSLGGTDPTITYSEANWYEKGDPRRSNGEVEVSPDGTDGQLKKILFSALKKRSGNTYQGCILLH